METNNTIATTTPDFPIPYINQEPIDDLLIAKTMFEIMDVLFDQGIEHGMSRDAVLRVSTLFSTARELLRPIQRYLDNDTRPGSLELYHAARRAEIVKFDQRGQA